MISFLVARRRAIEKRKRETKSRGRRSHRVQVESISSIYRLREFKRVLWMAQLFLSWIILEIEIDLYLEMLGRL